jgi:hypothetical protein
MFFLYCFIKCIEARGLNEHKRSVPLAYVLTIAYLISYVKPFCRKLFCVLPRGLEPLRPHGHLILSQACLPNSITRAYVLIVSGFEPV